MPYCFKYLAVLAVAGLLLTACSTSNTPAKAAATTAPVQIIDSGQAAAASAQQALANKLGLKTADVSIESTQQTQWTDSCLGAPQTGESCSQGALPGYRILLSANGKLYEAHTTKDGSTIRLMESTTQITEPGVQGARQILAQQLHLQLTDIHLTSVEQRLWPDACLGLPIPGPACDQTPTQGYLVVLDANNQRYEFHTDSIGGNVLLSRAPTPQIGTPILTWQSAGQPCQSIELGASAVAFGYCGGAQMQSPYADALRIKQLNQWVSTYRSFSGVTPAGQITFTGQGNQDASPAVQRAMAQWAMIIDMEAVGGHANDPLNILLSWRGSNTSVGFCNEVNIYGTGEVFGVDCNSGAELGPLLMTSQQIDQLYQWVDQFNGVSIDSGDAASADSIVEHLDFAGQGQWQPTDLQKQALLKYAQQVNNLFVTGQ
jgi:hypothetical protein